MSSHSASGSRSRSHSQSSHGSHGSDSSDSVALPSNPPAPAVEPVTEAGQTATTTPAAAEGAPQGAVEAGPPSEGKTSLYIGFGQDKNTRDISARALQEYMQNILYQLNGKTEDDEAQDALYAAEQAAAAAAAAATAEAEGEEKKESEEKPAEGAQEKPAEAAAEVAAEGEKKEGEGQGGNEEEGSKAEGTRPRRERRPRRFPPVQKRTNGVLHVRMSFRCAFAEIATRKEALQLVEALNGKPYGEEYTLTVELSQPKPKPERKERKERKERGSSRRERDGGASSRRGGRRDSPARRDRRSPPRRDRNAIVMFIGLGPRARDIRDAELRDSLNRFVPIRALRRSGTCAFAEVENYRDGDYLIDRANGMRLGEVRVAVQYSRESIRPPGGVVDRRRGRSRSHSRGRRSRSRSPSDSRRRGRDDSRDRRRRRRSYTPSRSRSYSRSRSRTPERRRR